jgi:hypothetical protein
VVDAVGDRGQFEVAQGHTVHDLSLAKSLTSLPLA